MVAEALGGLLTGSLALLADAGHMLAMRSRSACWYAFHLAGRRPLSASPTVSAGSRRWLPIPMASPSSSSAVDRLRGWGRLLTPARVLGGPMLVVAIAGLLVNIGSFFVLHGGDKENLNMRGAILHVLGDLLVGRASLPHWSSWRTGWTPIDPILSVLVSLLICRRLGADARSRHVLLEGVPASSTAT